MQALLEVYPGAQRALFRGYHIGGCSSCAFKMDETLEEVCQRNNNLDVSEVLRHIQASHEEDSKLLISPEELNERLKEGESLKLIDIRSREEFEAARIEGSELLSQSVMQEILGSWPREALLVIIDHQGRQGLDAAAYFSGQGLHNVKALRGGLDAWSQEVDPEVPRYEID